MIEDDIDEDDEDEENAEKNVESGKGRLMEAICNSFRSYLCRNVKA